MSLHGEREAGAKPAEDTLELHPSGNERLSLDGVEPLVREAHDFFRYYLTVTPPYKEDNYEALGGFYQDLEHKGAEIGRKVGDRLDTLSTEDRARYVQQYCEDNGFPNRADTTNRIASHAKQSIETAAQAQGVSVAYAGYSSLCSIGRGTAIPSSDIDFFTVLLRDDNPDVLAFTDEVVRQTNPQLTSMDHVCSVFTLKRLTEFANYVNTHGRTINYDRMYRADWGDGEIETALALLSNIAVGVNVINSLSRGEQTFFKSLGRELSSITSQRASVFYDAEKHKARDRLVALWPTLNADEQFVVVRIMQTLTEGIALNHGTDAPLRPAIDSLRARGLLFVERKNLKAPWAAYPWIFRNFRFWFYQVDSFK